MNPAETRQITLTEFLLARIAEDEQMARSAQATASIYDPALVRWHWLRTNGHSSAWEPTSHDPARVLAECEVKWRIVERLRVPDPHDSNEDCADCDVLYLLALPYADHMDYREEWRA